MELKDYLYLVYRHKFMMLLTCIIAVLITMKLTKKLPESFSSRARLATGLVDQSQVQVLDNKIETQESQINLQFANLIQSIQLKKIVDQVSYKLMLHELEGKEPYRKKSKEMLKLSKAEVQNAMAMLKQKYETRESLFLYDPKQKAVDDLISSMGFDYESIKKKITIFRISNSDFVDIECEGENPYMCASIINTLCYEFISYYNFIVKENHVKGVNFLESLMIEKRENMLAKMDSLKQYKIKNRVLNLNEQAKSIYAQIADFESRKELTEKDVIAFSGAIGGIEGKFDPKSRMYQESNLVKVNEDIMASQEILKRLNENYHRSGYDPKFRKKVDSMRTVVSAQITQLSDKYLVNPLSGKESLISKKLDLDVQLDIAKHSIASLESKINSLNQKYDKLVPHEAVIQTYETEIDIASKEYIEILQKFNQSTMESNITPRVKQIEMAMPGPPAPSKKNLLIAVSGIVPIVLYMVVLLVAYFMDDSLKNARELADKTNISVLGYLPLLTQESIDLHEIWSTSAPTPVIQTYKDQLRSSRFEIEQEMKDKKVLSLTSLGEGEGKSFVALSLAYAFAKAKKKVMLIDGDFDNPAVTEITKPKYFLEDYLSDKLALEEISIDNDGISFLGNRRTDTSLFELCDEHIVKEKIDALKNKFDLIIIDGTSLNNLNKAKEWIVMGDKVVSVFKANESINKIKDLKLNYLRELNEQYIGWLLNKVSAKRSKLSMFLRKLRQKLRNKNRKKKKKALSI